MANKGVLKIATAGEALMDLIARPDGLIQPCMGGSVFNLSRALARQGIGTLYLNPLSRDRFGRQLATALVADGVILAQPEPVAQPSSLAMVGLTDSGQPDYSFYRDGVADRAVSAQQLIEFCVASPELQMVCTGCLALAPLDAGIYLPWLRASREAGKTVVLDVNLRPTVIQDMAAYRTNVLTALQFADVIKASDEDLHHLGLPGASSLEQARHLLRGTSAKMLALTLGAKGAGLLMADGRTWLASELHPLTVVDTVGAGDCFLAGLLSSLLISRNLDLGQLGDGLGQQMLSNALASASLCVMRRGCAPPTREEVEARMSKIACHFQS